jgi:hypothetical protein
MTGREPLPDPKGKPPRVERRLKKLPRPDEPLSAVRDWLTKALAPAAGFRVEDFLRHGRQRTDGCELVLLGPGGQRRYFEVGEQRLLSTAGTVRATVVAATDALCRPGSLTKAEQEDIWVALVTLATVTANQDLKDEARDWLEQAEAAAERIEGHTLEPPGRLDALQKLVDRRYFNRLRALEYSDPLADPATKPRPALLVDKNTGERWMRVGEVACFLRHVLGTPSMTQPTIDGRLAAFYVDRKDFSAKGAAGYAKASLYRLPDEPQAGGGAGAEEGT